MTKKYKKTLISQKIANVFGAFGYLGVCFQWLWSLLPLAYTLIENNTVRSLIIPEHRASNPSTLSVELPGFVEIIVMAIALVFAISITIYAIYLIPNTVGKAGKKITQESAKMAVPVLTRHHKISKQKRAKLQFRITWLIKLLLVIAPLIIALCVQPSATGLERPVYLAVSIVITVFSALPFSIQFAIAKLAKIDPKQIW